MHRVSTSLSSQAEPGQVSRFLEEVLTQQLEAEKIDWLNQQRQKVRESGGQQLFLSFGLASRYFDATPLVLRPGLEAAAEKIRAGLKPGRWSQLQAARALLLLELSERSEASFVALLNRLAETADVAEQTALYAALPVLPHPMALRKRAAEGIRSNITPVFDAIALYNPFPADYLEEGPWNQMVVKAVFLNRPLYQIWEADRRANAALAHTLLDFVHERWAANRSFTPELWRFVGPFLQKDQLQDLARVLEHGTPLEQEAASLACQQNKLPEAKILLQQHAAKLPEQPATEQQWQNLGQRFQQQ